MNIHAQNGKTEFMFTTSDGYTCCPRAFCTERGLNESFVYSQVSKIRNGKVSLETIESAPGQTSQGGQRIPGVIGLSSQDHWGSTQKELNASDMLRRVKDTAETVPNLGAGEKGSFQIDRQQKKSFYEKCVQELSDDSQVPKKDIPSAKIFNLVWKDKHSDLVMRETKNVETKSHVWIKKNCIKIKPLFAFFLKSFRCAKNCVGNINNAKVMVREKKCKL